MSRFDIWTDGGVIARNPSTIGGSWAWVMVDTKNNRMVDSDSGIVVPDEKTDTIKNNFTELYATLKALEAVSPEWDGVLHTDSLVTLYRLTGSNSFTGIPDEIKEWTLKLRKDRRWQVELVAGHATKAEILRGTRKRNGLPTSKWNTWCDVECKRVAAEFMTNRSKHAKRN